MADKAHFKTRVVSVVAATTISLACGTNYAYSAWGPQFAERMKLSATQSNLIGAAGNVGMYASGIPVGLLVDSKGPTPSVLLGSIALGAGYFPIKKAFDGGAGSMSVSLLCFLSFLTGMGSCASFSASIKTSALNWPHHRGTATGLPLSAFGLSALFFTLISRLAFPDDTSNLLLFLAIGTFCMVFGGMFFLRVVPQPQTAYAALPTSDSDVSGVERGFRRDSNRLKRTKSGGSKRSLAGSAQDDPAAPDDRENVTVVPAAGDDLDERSSLMSKSSSGPGDIEADERPAGKSTHSHKPDVTGLALLKHLDFWKLWVMMGLLTGVGLMTINNIGNDVNALWSHYDDSVSKSFIVERQLDHVTIISLMSFIGRLLSGIGSDLLVKRLHLSRFWCVITSASIFAGAQLVAINLLNPHLLFFLSGLTGLAYGVLFGVYPALVADAFGVAGLSLNWGFMTLAPVISGNVFNLCYGAFFDARSERESGGKPGDEGKGQGELVCRDGRECYRQAYVVTLVSSVVGVAVGLWCVHHEWSVRRRLEKEEEEEAHRA
ncbi:major facilitator superfamily domain-containing protein [Lineolata rhizophorae]|uniref:Major facilitator superfamily domain-containing protein n=1 Tax=Lineolata rhizophorae TaxID=578093 RepID=A0A6A6P0D7_9PEZI|nr:major facilitator superfamily domain-containing protein [Lineolata rhizophorae]